MLEFLKQKRSKGPTFFCIGAPRCGTTWLHKNLGSHPNIWLPPIKEIRYFKGKPGPQAKQNLIRKLLSAEEIERHKEWLSLWGGAKEEDISWYKSLFVHSNQPITGDISPIYCTLSPQEIAQVYGEFPDAKIILMLRDPIERDWSHAKFKLHYQQKKPVPLHIEDYKDFIDSEFCKSRSNYLRIIENWECFYAPENIFIGFYDQIAQESGKLLGNICHFLGVPYLDEFFQSSVREKVHSSNGLLGKKYNLPLPDELATYMATQVLHWLPELERVKTAPQISSWRAHAENIAKQQPDDSLITGRS